MIRLEVTTHSGDNDIIEVETYNSKEISELRNSGVESIALGDNSYSRIDLKNIKLKPIEENVE